MEAREVVDIFIIGNLIGTRSLSSRNWSSKLQPYCVLLKIRRKERKVGDIEKKRVQKFFDLEMYNNTNKGRVTEKLK